MGETGFCNNQRLPVISCEELSFSANPKPFDFQRPFRISKITEFDKYTCASTRLCNAPRLHSVDSILQLPSHFDFLVSIQN